MKNNKLVDAIGKIDDKYIKEAHERKKLVFDFALVGKFATVALVLFLVVGVVPNMFRMGGAQKADNASQTESYDFMQVAQEEINYKYSDSNFSINTDNNFYGFTNELDTTKQAKNDNTKIIVTGNLEAETLDFDVALDILEGNIKKYDAYTQSSSINSNRNDRRLYDACIRIPAESYNEFLDTIKEKINVIYYHENTSDITEEYFDIQAKITSLKTEETKVLEFYDKAANIEELMSIESRLSNIRYEIDSLETKIKNYDLLVKYSTLNICINETIEYTKTNDNFFSKLKINFVNGWSNFVNVIQDIIIDIIYNMWSILIIVVFIVVGIIIYKKKKNK